ncbi:AAA family ATPase [Phenylobacterium soli]|uniref:AAA family ATPase n=1 Tax=Phenylobacterium soli TaxID=2170551 RepID=UPI001402AFD7|nr:ATP-binding protein [Phenylobacterium soli]
MQAIHMPTLNISEFSCLDEATFQLAPVNVIIGPQGSGKSVTTKLFYFLTDIQTSYFQYAERGDTIEDYKKQVARLFKIWFPPSAWGQGRFNIGYTAGDFSVRLLRRKSQGKLSEDLSVTFSEWFSDIYNETRHQFERQKDFEDIESTSNLSISELDRGWRVREVMQRRALRDLERQYIGQQTFIPAGRAFFTSIGRLVAGLEQAGSLDPVTLKFARLFANLRDRNASRRPGYASRLGHEFLTRRKHIMNQLFGGEIRFENETEFVQAEDGRRIPFTSLSSGQQELLPMWSLMDYFSEIDALTYRGPGRPVRRASELVYIEEPEAHLFPSAQSLLMEFLIGSLVSERSQRSLVITTHSPYIMGKLNVFLKAGQLSRRKKRNQDINNVVPRDCWLDENRLSALAIENGTMRDLTDSDGLIDGTYLDQVSEDISRQFSTLLKIESEI